MSDDTADLGPDEYEVSIDLGETLARTVEEIMQRFRDDDEFAAALGDDPDAALAAFDLPEGFTPFLMSSLASAAEQDAEAVAFADNRCRTVFRCPPAYTRARCYITRRCGWPWWR
jgi:hypothetical protein